MDVINFIILSGEWILFTGQTEAVGGSQKLWKNPLISFWQQDIIQLQLNEYIRSWYLEKLICFYFEEKLGNDIGVFMWKKLLYIFGYVFYISMLKGRNSEWRQMTV